MKARGRLRSCRCHDTQVRHRYLRVRRSCRLANTVALNRSRGQWSLFLLVQILQDLKEWQDCTDCGGCTAIGSRQFQSKKCRSAHPWLEIVPLADWSDSNCLPQNSQGFGHKKNLAGQRRMSSPGKSHFWSLRKKPGQKLNEHCLRTSSFVKPGKEFGCLNEQSRQHTFATQAATLAHHLHIVR